MSTQLPTPINYLAMMPGLDLSKQFEGLGEALSGLKQQQDRELHNKGFLLSLDEYRQNKTPEKLASLVTLYPDKMPELAVKQWNTLAEEEKQAEFKNSMQIQIALETGNTQMGIERLTAIVSAKKAAGLDASGDEQVLGLVMHDPQKALELISSTNSVVNPKSYKETKEAQTSDQTASKAKAEAIMAVEQQKNIAKSLQLDNKGKQANIAQSYASAAAASAQAAKTREETINIREERVAVAKGALVGDNLNKALKIGDAFEKQVVVKKAQDALGSYDGIMNAPATAIGDRQMIYAMFKMWDPNSTVMATEYATIQNTPNVPQQIRDFWNTHILKGQALPPEVRAQMRASAKSQVEGYIAAASVVKEHYDGVSRASGIDPKYTTGSFNVLVEKTRNAARPTANTQKVVKVSY